MFVCEEIWWTFLAKNSNDFFSPSEFGNLRVLIMNINLDWLRTRTNDYAGVKTNG